MAKTGPKPLSPEDYAHKYSVTFNYKLLRVLGDRKFEVKCNACNELRIVECKHSKMGHACRCTHKRQFYKVKRTPKTYTEHLKSAGKGDYKCIKITEGEGSKDSTVFTYKHNCGFVFDMRLSCFNMCIDPCSKCRPWVKKPNDVYVAEVTERSNNIRVIEKYKGTKTPILHQYIKCGHKVSHQPETLFKLKTIGICPICHPNHIWFKFRINGKDFNTRSLIEKAFVEHLVKHRATPVDDIVYEPKESVDYFNPRLNRMAKYSPDFKVGDTYIEIKDLSSLGLRDYHWMPKEEALIENRAKAEAASLHFAEYKTYVHIDGMFYPTEKFWTKNEITRLLNLKLLI